MFPWVPTPMMAGANSARIRTGTDVAVGKGVAVAIGLSVGVEARAKGDAQEARAVATSSIKCDSFMHFLPKQICSSIHSHDAARQAPSVMATLIGPFGVAGYAPSQT